MKRKIEELVREFLITIGENVNREGLQETPERVARMWIDELISGYFNNPDRYVKKFSVKPSKLKHKEIVVIRDVPVRSVCEHHLLPIYGYAYIAYIPNEQVLGFSKFARIIDVFSKRLQIQERLTEEIADYLDKALRPEGLVLMINALHTCALIRGVEEPMFMTTLTARGVFEKDESLKREVISILTSSKTLTFNGLNHLKESL